MDEKTKDLEKINDQMESEFEEYSEINGADAWFSDYDDYSDYDRDSSR